MNYEDINRIYNIYKSDEIEDNITSREPKSKAITENNNNYKCDIEEEEEKNLILNKKEINSQNYLLNKEIANIILKDEEKKGLFNLKLNLIIYYIIHLLEK